MSWCNRVPQPPSFPSASTGGGGGANLKWEVPTGTINGTNDTFGLTSTPLSGKLMLFCSSRLLKVGGSFDYTIAGSVITIIGSAIPVAGEWLYAHYEY